MSPLAGFLIFIVSLTAIFISYLTKQFQEENIIYSNNKKSKIKTQIQKHLKNKKSLLNSHFRLAMFCMVEAVGAYLTTGKFFLFSLKILTFK